MELARVNGQEIAFEDTAGEGTAVLFSHGLLMDHSMFDAQVEFLRGEFRCIAWDQRGHGGTPATEPFSYWDSANDALALLDYLGVAEAVLVGMSQGGFVSLRIALQSAQRVQGLVLIDTQAGTEDVAAIPLYQALLDEWVANGPANVEETIASIIFGGGYDPKPWYAKWEAQPRDNLILPFRALIDRDSLVERLGEINTPTLICHGDEDAAIPIDKARELESNLPGARPMVIVQGAGHASNMSHPEQVNSAIQGFLRSLH
ncbi:MAG TPA: alpha/beta hydrolase [Acidimicrobiales bacterium]|nr:alpha/beta hydrolase [Acidimicrobiales bacterium]